MLTVGPDRPMTIPDQNLELDLARNEYIYHNFRAAGAVGHVRWSVSGGELPEGLSSARTSPTDSSWPWVALKTPRNASTSSAAREPIETRASSAASCWSPERRAATA
jgi:hypothetical protein